MKRLALAVVVVGVALSSVLASQGRGRIAGGRGSASLVPTLVHPAGATQRGGGSYRSPGTEGETFELTTDQRATTIEERYRTQLTAAGWKVESAGGDPNIAFSRFVVPGAGSTESGTLAVTPIESGRLWVALRLVESMAAPAPRAPKTTTEMMDWMLRQLPRPATGEPPAVASTLPGTFPTELLPQGFSSSRILSTTTGGTVAGLVGNARPSDLVTFFADLRRAGWSDRLRAWLTDTFVVAEFCKNDVRAALVFNVEPARVVMAGVNADRPASLGCESTARRSPGITGPVVVLPSEWAPAHVDGGGGESHWRSGVRLNTAAPVASILAGVESQITASGYRVVARASDSNQAHVRFASTQSPGSPAIVLLSVTKLPWSQQIDAVYEVVTQPRR